MRIVAGRHRGRRLEAPAGGEIRPTGDWVREALFDILAHAAFAGGGGWTLVDAQVLDAFAGSGALGLEALSRGAAHAVFMDTATAALAAVRRNADRLGEGERVTLLRADPGKPPAAPAPAALVLMDPPYRSGLAAPALAALKAQGWLAEDAIAVVELAANEDFAPPPGFALADARTYGAAKLVFLAGEGA